MKYSRLKLQDLHKLKSLRLLVFLAPVWYLYWIFYDVIIWNKPLVEVNLTNYIALIGSLSLILATSKLRVAMNPKTTDTKREVTENDSHPNDPKLFLQQLLTEENALQEEKQKLVAFKEKILRHVKKEMRHTKKAIQSLESDISHLKSECEQFKTVLGS